MKKLKIAFCFSGQLRTWKHCYSSWERLMELFDIAPDIFIHTWDFNTDQQRIQKFAAPAVNINKIPQSEIDDYIKTLKPKYYKVENNEVTKNVIERVEEEIRTLNPNTKYPYTISWQVPQFYSMMRASFLKQKYELENNFEYDLVFKFRNDIYFSADDINKIINANITSDILHGQTIFSVHSAKSDYVEAGYARVGDIFFISSSYNYNMISNFSRMIPYIYNNGFNQKVVPPEIYFTYFLKSLNISYDELGIPIKIGRTSKYFEQLKKENLKSLSCDILLNKK